MMRTDRWKIQIRLLRATCTKAQIRTWSHTRPLEYERVYLPLYKVADTLLHIQGVTYVSKVMTAVFCIIL